MSDLELIKMLNSDDTPDAYKIAKHIRQMKITDWHKFLNQDLTKTLHDMQRPMEFQSLEIRKQMMNNTNINIQQLNHQIEQQKAEVSRLRKLQDKIKTVSFQKDIEYHLSKIQDY